MAAVLFAATAAHGWLIVSSVPARATDDGMFGQQLAAIATCLWPPPQRLSAGFLPPNHHITNLSLMKSISLSSLARAKVTFGYYT